MDPEQPTEKTPANLEAPSPAPARKRTSAFIVPGIFFLTVGALLWLATPPSYEASLMVKLDRLPYAQSLPAAGLLKALNDPKVTHEIIVRVNHLPKDPVQKEKLAGRLAQDFRRHFRAVTGKNTVTVTSRSADPQYAALLLKALVPALEEELGRAEEIKRLEQKSLELKARMAAIYAQFLPSGGTGPLLRQFNALILVPPDLKDRLDRLRDGIIQNLRKETDKLRLQKNRIERYLAQDRTAAELSRVFTSSANVALKERYILLSLEYYAGGEVPPLQAKLNLFKAATLESVKNSLKRELTMEEEQKISALAQGFFTSASLETLNIIIDKRYKDLSEMEEAKRKLRSDLSVAIALRKQETRIKNERESIVRKIKHLREAPLGSGFPPGDFDPLSIDLKLIVFQSQFVVIFLLFMMLVIGQFAVRRIGKTRLSLTAILIALQVVGLAWLYNEKHYGMPFKIQTATLVLIDAINEDPVIAVKLTKLPAEVVYHQEDHEPVASEQNPRSYHNTP